MSTTAPSSAASGPSTFLRRHAGVLIAALPVVLVVLKIATVSRFSLTTGEAILDATRPVNALTGVLLPLVPTALLFSGWWITLLYPFAPGRWVLSDWVPVIGWFLIATAVWAVPLFTLIGFVVGLWFRSYRPPRSELPGGLTGYVVFLVTVFTVLQVLVSTQMWLPAERIKLATQKKPVVGYVLDAGSPWSTILREDEPEVIRVRTNDVRRRVLCDPSSDFLLVKSAGALIAGSEYESC